MLKSRLVFPSLLALTGALCGYAADVAETKASVVGTTLKLDVKSGETLNYSTLLNSLGITAIEKDGLGKAYFNYGVSVTNTYTGTITIKAGTLGASSLDNYGTPSLITVESGGALDLSQANGAPGDPKMMYNGGTKLVFGGNGPDNTWAVYRKDGAGGADHIFKNAEMTADATVGGAKRWGLGGDSNGKFNMNSHTLTVDNTGVDFLLDGFTAQNPGRIIKKGTGNVVFQNGGINMGGGATNELLLTAGSLGLWNNNGDALKWQLTVAGNSTFQVNAQGGPTRNIWDGDIVHTNGTLELKAGNAKSVMTLRGNVTTTDCEAMAGGKAGPYVRVNQGNPGLVRFLGGCWTNVMTHGATSECLDINGGAFEFAGTGPHRMGRVGVHSTNVWFHNCGHITKSSAWYVENVRNAANASNLALLNLENLVLDTSDSGQITLANSNTNAWGTLRIGEGAVVTSGVQLAYNGLAALHVVQGGKLRWTGGHISNYTGYKPTDRMAQGYILLDGGTIERSASDDLHFAENGRALYLQRAGNYRQEKGMFYLFTRGDCEVVIAGGSFCPIASALTTWQCQSENTTAAAPGCNRQMLTITGTGVVDVGNFIMSATNACQFSMMLSKGGIFKTNRMYMQDRDKRPNVRWDFGFDGGVLKPALGWVFFTISNDTKSPHAVTVYPGGAIFDTSECQHEYDKKTGQDYGSDCHFGAPLQAPTGKSVKAISLPTDAEFVSTRYNVPPKVQINGTGHAATAIADLDDVTGVVKGIIVTCPGYGYDDSTTVTIDSWNSRTQYACSVQLEEMKDGGLVKRGANGLVLYNTGSTFTGDITIEGGFLQQHVSGAIPPGRTVHLATGWLNLNNHALSVNRLTGYGTVDSPDAATLTVTGGVDVAAADMLAGRQVVFTNSARVAFNAGVQVRIDGLATALSQLTPEERKLVEKNRYRPLTWNTPLDAGAEVPEVVGLPEGWHASLSVDRRSIRVNAARGLTVIVR